MGVAITELLHGKEVRLEDLKEKAFAVDAFNMLYQFVTTIRTPDGTPLKDRHGNVTSHLIGLFSRSTALMAQGLRLIFVFDGAPPELKRQEQERRSALKAEALHKYKEAEQAEDTEGMKKYAGRAARLSSEMVEESKELLAGLGLPVVQAPSEGEAQAAHICKRGDAYAVISQDADSFLFGAPRVVRNLNITGKRKRTNTLTYERVNPEMYALSACLQELGLSREQLIILSMLVGTDYNREGIRGIGPKKALKLLHEKGKDYDGLFNLIRWSDTYPDLPWQELLQTFLAMPTTDEYRLAWQEPDVSALKELLVERHDFSEERVMLALQKLRSAETEKQRGLGDFLG